MSVLLLFAGALLIVSSSTRFMLAGYMILTAAVCSFEAPSLSGPPASILFFALAAIVKLGVIPIGILLFVREDASAADLRSSGSVPMRLLLVIVFAFVSKLTAHSALFAAIPEGSIILYTLLCGIATLVVHRNLLAHVVGLLALGTAITLAGPALAPRFPQSFELGASFDALVSTFIALSLIRAFLQHHPALDVEELRELRG